MRRRRARVVQGVRPQRHMPLGPRTDSLVLEQSVKSLPFLRPHAEEFQAELPFPGPSNFCQLDPYRPVMIRQKEPHLQFSDRLDPRVAANLTPFGREVHHSPLTVYEASCEKASEVNPQARNLAQFHGTLPLGTRGPQFVTHEHLPGDYHPIPVCEKNLCSLRGGEYYLRRGGS